MSNACYDWTPVGYSSHPVPGDPEVVAASATTFGNTSQHLRTAASALRKLDSSDTVSDAVTKLRSNAVEIAGLLEQAHDRYQVASQALAKYAPELQKAQYDAEQAVQAASGAKVSRDRARKQVVAFYQQAKNSTDPNERQEYLQAYYRAKANMHDADANLNNAKAKVEAAIQHRNNAASTAKSTIDASIADRDLNDGFMDKLKELWDNAVEIGKDFLEKNPLIKGLVDAIKNVATWIWDHIDEISIALTVLSLAVGWIPVAGWVITALAVASKVAMVISKAKFLVGIAQGVVTGVTKGNWGPLAAAGASWLIGKGVGKALSAGYKSFAGKVSKKSWQIIARESQAATGSLRSANNVGLASTTHKPGFVDKLLHPKPFSLPQPGSPLTDTMHKIDSMMSSEQAQMFTKNATNAQQIAHMIDNSATKDLVTGTVKEGIDTGVKMVQDATDSAHRMTRQDCPA